jgi:elongation factor G
MTSRLGSIEQGNTVCDADPEEIERGISIMTALCYAEYGDHKVNILDTPGYAEFITEVAYAIWVADTSILVLDAAAGVEVHTRRVYSIARERNLPIIAVVNKMDRERADFDAALASMQEALPGCRPVPVHLPLGSESDFAGVIDLIHMKAVVGSGAKAQTIEIPEEHLGRAREARTALVEAIAESDEQLIEEYLANDDLTLPQIISGLRAMLFRGEIVPVLCAAATLDIGGLPLLDFVVSAAPAPSQMPGWKGIDPESGAEIERKADTKEPFSAYIFKTLTDPYVGRISFLRVVSGMARADAAVVVGESGAREKSSGLALAQGRKTTQVGELWPGDLGCVTRLEAARTGDTLCEPRARIVFPRPDLPEPMHSSALRGATRQDEDKLGSALERAADEDAGFRYRRSEDTGELVVSGMGPLHLETVIARLQRQFQLRVELSEPKVPYMETITQSCRVHGRHKKQTGGRGQFGDVWIRVEPLPRGAGFEFVDAVVGGAIPSTFIPSVEKGCRAAMRKGPVAGYPVTDVKVTVDDGQTHPVDSSDIAFQLAGQIAMREALAQAAAILLEPIMRVEISTPDELTGDIVSDLNGRRARIQGMDQAGGGMTIIRGHVPLAELLRYAADLRSLSQGRASYVMEFSHYEPVPHHIAEQIIARARAAQAEES